VDIEIEEKENNRQIGARNGYMPSAKLLVVDDDRNLLELMKIRLEASGFEVTAARDEDEARTMMAEQVFDLAVIDLQLVHQDGISLMEEAHRVLPGLPVIILTAHGVQARSNRRGAYIPDKTLRCAGTGPFHRPRP
jgi:two-component system response regulator GlrR